MSRIQWQKNENLEVEAQKLIEDLENSVRFPTRDKHWAQVVGELLAVYRQRRSDCVGQCS